MKSPKVDARGVRAFGPIPASSMSVGIPMLEAGRRGIVDIGQFRGTAIPITYRLAGRLLGTARAQIADLIREGLLKPAGIDRGRGRDYVLIDPAWVLMDVYLSWTVDMPQPDRHADFSRFDRIRRLCRVPDDHPVPEQVIDGLFRRLLEIGNFGRGEAGMFLQHNDVRWAHVKAGLNDRLATFCARGADRAPPRVSLEMLRRALPQPIANAPRTCFEQAAVDGAELEDGIVNPGREAPSERAMSQLWRMGRLFEFASLYALVGAARMRRPVQLSDHLTVIARVEDIMMSFAPTGRWTREAYLEAFRAYAIDQTIRPNDTPFVRDLTVRYWRVFIWEVRSYLRQQPQAVAGELRRYVPSMLRLSFEFRRELKERYGHLRAAGRASRKMRSHQAMVELDAIVDATQNRRDELRALGDAARKEMDDFGPEEQFRAVGVTLPILDERGNLAGGTQTIWLGIWRLAAADASLNLGVVRVGTTDDDADDAAGVASVASEAPKRPEFIVEHLRTEPVGPSKARDPWMFILDRLFVTSRCMTAGDDLKEARHQAIAERGLPGIKLHAAGTLSFDIWRARIKRQAIAAGRHFVPLEEIEYGMRLACHALDCVNQSFNRPHEVRQQRLKGWEEMDLPDDVDSEEAWHKQTVVGKVQPRRDLAQVELLSLTIRETSLNEAIDIAELHMRQLGLKTLPTMKAPSDFRWKCPPGQYLISSNGVALSRFQLTLLVHYLLDGWADYTLYDFRHANAEDAALDHLHPRLIMLLLGQRSIESALYYSLLDDWAKEIVEDEELRRRMHDQDARLSRSHRA